MLLQDEAKTWLMTKNIKIYCIHVYHVQHHRAISVYKAQILRKNQKLGHITFNYTHSLFEYQYLKMDNILHIEHMLWLLLTHQMYVITCRKYRYQKTNSNCTRYHKHAKPFNWGCGLFVYSIFMLKKNTKA